jgi:hypothetical protein
MLLLTVLVLGCETNTDGLRSLEASDAGREAGGAELPAVDLVGVEVAPPDTRPAELHPGVDAGTLTCVPAGPCVIQTDTNQFTSVSCYENGVKVVVSYDFSASPAQKVYTTYTAGPGYLCTVRNNPQPGLQTCAPGACTL